MLEVDGGEGGGQLVRSALALSMLDGEAVEITDVRGTRPTPGLKPQHLTAVSAAAEVCDAAVEGADGGSETIRFEPAAPSGGRYEADIGTAGSLTLLFDTFLPLATQIDEPLTITATGGTDVKWSPPIAYYRTVKLPLLRRLGIAAAVECEKTGFYPAGGGRATLRLWPSTLSPIELTERGRPTTARVYSKASTDLADGDVVERQADTATDALAGLGIEVVHHRTTYAATESSGSVVTVRVDAGGSPVGFDAYGAPEKSAEDVARETTDAIRRWRESGAAVDAHLGDQLLVFLALAGGEITIPRVTDHVSSNRDLLAAFGREVTVDESGRTPALVADR
ncbi:RNA 3'-terminal phosphate cyclase [Halosimplex aquaticum]|uniref:RNA 3'-terminal phosphate cyclase n=1 Tax=Halosimplex aquaticum TaxID=3026162 RepID=A0ABD5Y814_9EURY|nr:RNA 3'-terminal phosphate cyclase [Halosimplex aquaticum]